MPFQQFKAFACLCVPDTDILVISTAHNGFCIFTELHTGQSSVVTLEHADTFAGFNVPKLDQSVSGCTDNLVTADHNGVDRAAMALQLAKKPPGIAIPDANGGVLGAGDNVPFIEAHIQDPPFMVNQFPDLGVGWQRPNNAGVVRRARHKDFVVELKTKYGCSVEILIDRALYCAGGL